MLLLLLLCSPAVVLRAAGTPAGREDRTDITLPSGRQISLGAVRALLPRERRHRVATRLYELTEGGRLLVGPFGQIDMRPVIEDGVEIPLPEARLPPHTGPTPVLRSGAGLTVALLADGSVLGVWGRGLSLAPLHRGEYPNVFVHSPVSRTQGRADARRDHMARLQSARFEGDRAVSHVRPAPAVEDLLSGGDVSARNSDPEQWTAARMTGDACLQRTVSKEAEVAVAFDSKLCARYGGRGAAVAAVRAALALARGPFARQTCISLVLVHVEGTCDGKADPYASFRGLGAHRVLDAFASFWSRNRGGVHRDLALLTTSGAAGTSNTRGVAFVGAACSHAYAYAWTDGLHPALITHEVAHVLGADHAQHGIMTPVLNLGALDRNPSSFAFSPQTVAELAHFIDHSGRASCIAAKPRRAPSSSPVPSRKASPSPSPKPSSPPTARPTCQTWLSRNSALRCTGVRKYTSIVLLPEAEGARSGSPTSPKHGVTPPLTIRIRQVFGSFSVSYRAKHNYRVLRVAHVMSTNAESPDSLLDIVDTFGTHGKKQVVFKQHPSTLNSRVSCCGKRVFVHFYIETCNRARRCYEGAASISYTVACRYCPRGKHLLPSSNTRRCPVCNKI